MQVKLPHLSLCAILPWILIFSITDVSAMGKKADINNTTIEKGQNLIDRFEFEKAIGLFEQKIVDNPINYKWHYYLGEAIRSKLFYARYKELSPEQERSLIIKSESSFKTALELNPNSYEAKIGIAKLSGFERNYSEAIKWYSEVISSGVHSSDIYTEIGRMYAKNGQIEIANEYFASANDREKSDNNVSIFVSKFTNDSIFRKTNDEIVSYVFWTIVDPVLFKGWFESRSNAENIVQDIYSANLINSLIGKEKPREIYDIHKIKNEIIQNCNKGKLKLYGIRIIDIVIE